MKRIIGIILSICIGLTFIFSAYTKIIDIDPFEWTIAETGIFSFKVANILARIIIAAEFFIGILFITQIALRRFTFGFAAVLLLLFNVYLLYILFTYGNSNNCGCFGNMLRMTPLQAYFKNLLLLFLIYIISFFYNGLQYKNASLFIDLIAVVCILGVGIYEKPYFIYKNEQENLSNVVLDLNELRFENGSAFNYSNGKYIISFFSTSCHFCRKAARKMHSMYTGNSTIPFVNIIYGAKGEPRLNDFFKETLSEHVPHLLTKNMELFEKATHHKLPAIYWVNNGKVINSSNYFNLDDKEIINWIKQ